MSTHAVWRRYGPIPRKIEQRPLPRHHATKGIPYPGRTRRAISRGPPPSRMQKGSEDVQLEPMCGFFKLPWELREQIWEHILHPGEELHIVQMKDRLSFSPVQPYDRGVVEYSESQAGMLTLLKTNRRMYNEAIELLYTRNTFRFTKSNVLTSFQRTVIPQRLDALRHVVLDVRHSVLNGGSTFTNIAFNERIWKRSCESLTKMTGLHTLHIALHVGKQHWRIAGWDRFSKSKWPRKILEPLMAVRARDSFVLEYPWPSSQLKAWQDAPFEMRELAAPSESG